MEDGFSFNGSDVTIVENYLHSFADKDGAHHDGISNWGGENNVVIARNKILNAFGETSALYLAPDAGDMTNWLIDSNYLAGGGYTCYCGGTSHGSSYVSTNVKFTNNIFGLDFFENSGSYNAVAYRMSVTPESGNEFSNNRFSDGVPIP